MSETSSARTRPPVPEVLDLVEAEQVTADIEAIERELAVLEREAAHAVEAAAQAEETAQAVNVDASATTWTIVRLQRFLDELRSEAERDAATMIEVAHYHAQVRVKDARAMVAGGRAARVPLVFDSPLPDPYRNAYAPLPDAVVPHDAGEFRNEPGSIRFSPTGVSFPAAAPVAPIPGVPLPFERVAEPGAPPAEPAEVVPAAPLVAAALGTVAAAPPATPPAP